MDSLIDALKNADLTSNESKVYLKLLEFKEITANELAKKIIIDRSLTYSILNKLLDKGLASYKIKNSKKYFTASKPINILNNLKEKEAIVKEILPQLEQIQQLEESSYSIEVYEGKSGLRSWINLILKEKEYCAFGMTGKGYYELYEMPRIIKEIKEKKIKGKLIGYEQDNKQKKPHQLGFEYRYLPFKMTASTSVFGNYVSIHQIGEKPLIIVIKNKDIANSYKKLFDYLWKTAKN
jgi:sugar-specific transcriptional regulator TrmB